MYNGIIDFTKCDQSQNNIINYERDDLIADPHSIMNKYRNCVSQLLNVHRENDVRQTEIHASEPQVPELGAFEFEMAIEMLK
jgi:hypothetical protein